MQKLKDSGHDLARALGIDPATLKDCAAQDINLKIPVAKLLGQLKPEEFRRVSELLFYKDPQSVNWDSAGFNQTMDKVKRTYNEATAGRAQFEAGVERFGQMLLKNLENNPHLLKEASEHPRGVKGYVEMQKRILVETGDYQACFGVPLSETLNQVMNANLQSKDANLLNKFNPKKLFQAEQQRESLLKGKGQLFSQEDMAYVTQQPNSKEKKPKADKTAPYIIPTQPQGRKGM